MINVLIQKNADNLQITVRVEGHAMTAEKGQDTVCAAVSILVYGFAEEITKADEKDFRYRHVEIGDEGSGFARIFVACKNQKVYQRVLYNLSPMERALAVLQENNPQAVRIY
jgi:uncharacterized protein YsxB (DUF464 family)